MNTELSPQLIKKGLKSILKKNGYTYSDLSKVLDCSEVTAKRIMNQEELSLSRLLKILGWLSVDFKDLQEIIIESGEKEVMYTEEQDIFLAKHPSYFSYFLKLKTMSPDQIAGKYNLTKLSSDKYLIKLEQLGLIKVDSKGNVRLAETPPNTFLTKGRLAALNVDNLIKGAHDFFSQAMSKNSLSTANEQSAFIVYNFHASENTIKHYTSQLIDLLYEFITVAKTQCKTKSEADLKAGAIQVAYSTLPKGSKLLDLLEDNYEPIKNL